MRHSQCDQRRVAGLYGKPRTIHPAEAGSFADQACGRRDLRWVTPVNHFARGASADTEIRGHTIRRGESVCLFYPSANRDEEVFEERFKFEINRKPNPHIAFGIGQHFCLGANLTRLELEAIFRELARRLEYAEPAGPLERLRPNFVGGVKHMPIQFKMNA
jgi:cytochrome P450